MTGWINGRTEAHWPKPAVRARKAKKPLRRKAKRKAKLHDADTLFSTYIRTRDGWACRNCGSPYMVQCAHIVSRRYRATRWTPDNALALCQKCHLRWTHNPIAFEAWVDERFPGRLAALKVQALAAKQPVDYEEICRILKVELGPR